MKHLMKVQLKYYEAIKDGIKQIELRLYDEKRKEIKLGDTIEILKEPDLKERILVKVIGLLHYESFPMLLRDFDSSILAGSTVSKEELLRDLEVYYPKEKQAKFGVLGIRFTK